MATPYKAVNFVKHEVILRQDLNQLQNNLQWVKDNTARGRFYPGRGGPSDVRTVILGGKARINRNKKSDSAKVGVKFGKAFAPDCQPHVTTGVVSDFQRKIFCVVNGPRGVNYPNAIGFEININIAEEKRKADRIKQSFFVHWHAFGFRLATVNEF